MAAMLAASENSSVKTTISERIRLWPGNGSLKNLAIRWSGAPAHPASGQDPYHESVTEVVMLVLLFIGAGIFFWSGSLPLRDLGNNYSEQPVPRNWDSLGWYHDQNRAHRLERKMSPPNPCSPCLLPNRSVLGTPLLRRDRPLHPKNDTGRED